MKPVFLDASGLIAAANKADQWHDRAMAVWRDLIEQNAPLVTTSLVLFELGDGLAHVGQRSLAVELYDRLRYSPFVRTIFPGLEQTAAAWDLFRSRSDKAWGATDCASFVVMKELGIEEAFTVDHHFEQAGFRRLIRARPAARDADECKYKRAAITAMANRGSDHLGYSAGTVLRTRILA